MQAATIHFFDIVLFVHIGSVVLAFGVTFAYPLLFELARRTDRRSLPFLHRAQDRIGKFLITPAASLVLLSGIYLAAKSHSFSQAWVNVGMVAIVVLLGLGGAFFAPQERRAAGLAQRDVDAAGSGEVTMSAEYEHVAGRLKTVSALASLLVLVAVFFMAVKPFS
jgi:uncharacterized membrane protein